MLTQEERRDILSIFSDNTKWGWLGDIKITDDNDLLYEHDYYQQLDNLDYMDWGCTKLCLFFNNLSDWVIKIPLSQIQRVSDEEWHDFSRAGLSLKCVSDDIIEELALQGIDKSDWDYCYVEAALTLAAEKAGVEDMVCGTYFLGFDKDDNPVYASERMEEVMEYYEGDIPKSTKEGREEARHILADSQASSCEMRSSIGELFIGQYGKEGFKRLADFFGKYKITDLHDNNFMYGYDGYIRVTDMAGFNED